jgi:hypothetical protein
MVNRRRRTARHTHLKPKDKRLLEGIRGQRWTVEEFRWVLTHLDAQAPTLIVQELRAKLILLSAQGVKPVTARLGVLWMEAQPHGDRPHAGPAPL